MREEFRQNSSYKPGQDKPTFKTSTSSPGHQRDANTAQAQLEVTFASSLNFALRIIGNAGHDLGILGHKHRVLGHL
eukprot:1144312-Pelagomonas_calceolata.AAC.6